MYPSMSDPRYDILAVAKDPTILFTQPTANKNIKAYSYERKKDLLLRINAFIADNKTELMKHYEDGNYIEALLSPPPNS